MVLNRDLEAARGFAQSQNVQVLDLFSHELVEVAEVIHAGMRCDGQNLSTEQMSGSFGEAGNSRPVVQRSRGRRSTTS